jgi:hypothetical protein
MLDELIEMLAHPEQYECAWLSGELYARHCSQQQPAPATAAPELAKNAQRVREPELA